MYEKYLGLPEAYYKVVAEKLGTAKKHCSIEESVSITSKVAIVDGAQDTDLLKFGCKTR